MTHNFLYRRIKRVYYIFIASTIATITRRRRGPINRRTRCGISRRIRDVYGCRQCSSSCTKYFLASHAIYRALTKVMLSLVPIQSAELGAARAEHHADRAQHARVAVPPLLPVRRDRGHAESRASVERTAPAARHRLVQHDEDARAEPGLVRSRRRYRSRRQGSAATLSRI